MEAVGDSPEGVAMHLCSMDGGGVGVIEGEGVLEIGPPGPSTTPLIDLIARESVAPGTFAALRASATVRPLDSVRLVAPIPSPGAIIAAPVNYHDHMVEMSEARDIRHLGLFLKARSSVTGPNSKVRLPYTDRRFDHEGELGVVIGRIADDVPMRDALDYVFGYTCLFDITMRGGEDRSTRKSFRTFTPIGPYLVTSDEVGPSDDLRITVTVNGTVRQDASTREMIWSVPELVSYASSVMTLYPGDLIATGTPVGVGPITDGDELVVTIERVGALQVVVTATGAMPCPTLGAGSGPVPPPPPPPTGRGPGVATRTS